MNKLQKEFLKDIYVIASRAGNELKNSCSDEQVVELLRLNYPTLYKCYLVLGVVG